MQGIAFNVKLTQNSIKTMEEFAKTFPEKVQRRVFKSAGKKAAEAMVKRVQLHMPYNKKPKYNRPHMRDVVAYKVKTYRASGRTLFIIGYKSHTTRLQTLVEKGNFLTSPRMTRHESNTGRKRVAAGAFRRRRTVTRADGSKRTAWEMVNKTNQRSTGSRYVGSGVAKSTGDFPKSKVPFAPITKAAREMRSEIKAIMEAEIEAGFERAFYREAGRG